MMSIGSNLGDLDDIPPEYRERFIEIVARTEDFCKKHLNDECAEMCRRLARSVCHEDSPVLKAKAASWACGVAYGGFGVSPATMHTKCRAISSGLDLKPFGHPDFTIASRLDNNPLIWILKVNGVLVDIRICPTSTGRRLRAGADPVCPRCRD